jgi:peptidyl-prolyl cis-trans isomerase-like 2
MQVSTANTHRVATVEEIDRARYTRLRALKKKGYVQLQTTYGNINLEIHCDMVPRTAENFIGLCAKGYYDGTIFHRRYACNTHCSVHFLISCKCMHIC